jgi:hypothetical protein
LRPADWPERLEAFLRARNVPFAWGPQDCVTLTADWVRACIGLDPAARWRGWNTARQALATIKEAGGLRAGWGLALPEISPGLARRGDVGLILMGRREASVIVERETVVGAGALGLERLPRARLIAAYRVD